MNICCDSSDLSSNMVIGKLQGKKMISLVETGFHPLIIYSIICSLDKLCPRIIQTFASSYIFIRLIQHRISMFCHWQMLTEKNLTWSNWLLFLSLYWYKYQIQSKKSRLFVDFSLVYWYNIFEYLICYLILFSSIQ